MGAERRLWTAAGRRPPGGRSRLTSRRTCAVSGRAGAPRLPRRPRAAGPRSLTVPSRSASTGGRTSGPAPGRSSNKRCLHRNNRVWIPLITINSSNNRRRITSKGRISRARVCSAWPGPRATARVRLTARRRCGRTSLQPSSHGLVRCQHTCAPTHRSTSARRPRPSPK